MALLVWALVLAGCGSSRLPVIAGGSGWTTAGGSPANSGVAPGPQSWAAGEKLLWSRKTGGQAAGEPTVRDGLLFFPGADRRLEIYRIADGDRVFRKRFDGPVTGALPRDSVFEFLTDQKEQRYFVYDRSRTRKLSSFRTAVSRAAPRRLNDSLILIAGLNGVVYCYDNKGDVSWSVKTKGPIFAAPALSDSAVYISTGRRVVAVRRSDGSRLWNHLSSGAITAAPALDDQVYVGATDSLVYALDPLTGNMNWFFATGGGVFATPAVGPEFIYVAANDGLIYALRKTTGKQVWTFDTGAIANLSPTVAGAVLFVATREGRLLVLDAESGTLLREHRLDAPAVISPVVADGRIFVADVRRRLYCFGPGDDISLAQDSL